MRKAAVIDLFTVLRAVAVAATLVGLVLLLGAFAAQYALGRSLSLMVFLGPVSAAAMALLFGGLVLAAVMSVARWLVGRSRFVSEQPAAQSAAVDPR